MAKEIEAFNAINVENLFVSERHRAQQLPARLRSYAEQLQGRLKLLKQNAKGRPYATNRLE